MFGIYKARTNCCYLNNTPNTEVKWSLDYYIASKFRDFFFEVLRFLKYLFLRKGSAITHYSAQQIGKNTTTITDAVGNCSALPSVWLVFFILRLGESPTESYKVKQRRFKILIRCYLKLLTSKIVYLCLDAGVYICEHSHKDRDPNKQV